MTENKLLKSIFRFKEDQVGENMKRRDHLVDIGVDGKILE
jgi:hypothetical protein